MKKMTRIAVLLSAALCMAAGAAGTAWSAPVSLDEAFDPDRAAYSATVAHDVTEVTVNASTENPKARVTVNGGDPATPVALAVGENTITVVVTAEDGRHTRTYTVTVTRAAAPEPAPQQVAQQQSTAPLTAAFEGAPAEHDGKAGFWLNARFSEALGTDGKAPVVSSFTVTGGKAKRVERVEAGLWRVRVKPGSWREGDGGARGVYGLRGRRRGVHGRRPGAVERVERNHRRPGAHPGRGRQGQGRQGRIAGLRGDAQPRGGRAGVGGLRDRGRHGGGGGGLHGRVGQAGLRAGRDGEGGERGDPRRRDRRGQGDVQAQAVETRGGRISGASTARRRG